MEPAPDQEHTGWRELGVAQQALRVLLVTELALVLLHVGAVWSPAGTVGFHWIDRLHLSKEGNLPTAFSATQLAVLAGILVYTAVRSTSGRGARQAWVLGALGAAFLAADEWLRVHERVGTRFRSWLDTLPSEAPLVALQDFPGYHWVLVYLPVVGPLALATVWVLARELRPRQARRVAWGVAIFLVGAVCLDFLDAVLTRGELQETAARVALRHGLQLAEEAMEMVGVTLVLTAFLDYADRLSPSEAKMPVILEAPSPSAELT